jgi:hypothetical protein
MEQTMLIHLNRDQAFEYDNGQDLYEGGVGTWFQIRADKLRSTLNTDGYSKEAREELKKYGSTEIILVRGDNCGPGWFHTHPLNR